MNIVSSTDRTRVKIIFFSDSASEMLIGKLSARGFQIRSPIVRFASRFVFIAHRKSVPRKFYALQNGQIRLFY